MLKLDTSSVKRSSNTCAWIWIRWHLQVSENCFEEENCCVQIHHWWLMVVPRLYFSSVLNHLIPVILVAVLTHVLGEFWGDQLISSQVNAPAANVIKHIRIKKNTVLSKIQHNTLEEDGRMHEIVHTEGSATHRVSHGQCSEQRQRNSRRWMSDEQMAQVWPVSEACHGFSFLPASSWFGIDHWVTLKIFRNKIQYLMAMMIY